MFIQSWQSKFLNNLLLYLIEHQILYIKIKLQHCETYFTWKSKPGKVVSLKVQHLPILNKSSVQILYNVVLFKSLLNSTMTDSSNIFSRLSEALNVKKLHTLQHIVLMLLGPRIWQTIDDKDDDFSLWNLTRSVHLEPSQSERWCVMDLSSLEKLRIFSFEIEYYCLSTCLKIECNRALLFIVF